MLVTLEVGTVESGSCSDCGRHHRFRVALAPDEGAAPPSAHGFFGRCPVTGRRVWFVITLGESSETTGRLVEVGPPDDESWTPSGEDECDWAPRDTEHKEQFPPRGMLVGGFRATSRMPDLLRLALGCPHRS